MAYHIRTLNNLLETDAMAIHLASLIIILFSHLAPLVEELIVDVDALIIAGVILNFNNFHIFLQIAFFD